MDSKYIKKVETTVMELLGGRRTAFSGSGMVKGDGRVPGASSGAPGASGGFGGYRVESKATIKEFFRLTGQDWLDIAVSSASAHEEPIFHIRLKAQDRIWERDIAVVRLSTGLRLGSTYRAANKADAERKGERSHRLTIQTKLPTAFCLQAGERKETLLAMDLAELAGFLDEERNSPK